MNEVEELAEITSIIERNTSIVGVDDCPITAIEKAAKDIQNAGYRKPVEADVEAVERIKNWLLDEYNSGLKLGIGHAEWLARSILSLIPADTAREKYEPVQLEGLTDYPKCFIAYRRVDISETHNENQVNPPNEVQFEGVVFTDGTCAIRWRTAKRSTSVWNSFEDAMAIHGHPEYGTEIKWYCVPPDLQAVLSKNQQEKLYRRVK